MAFHIVVDTQRVTLDIIATALYQRHMESSSTNEISVRSSTGKHLAANIAPVLEPPTSELVERHVSRKE